MHAPFLAVPESFRQQILRRDPAAGITWLDRLPVLCADLCRRWRLTVAGRPAHGATSLVIPVVTGPRRAALKLIGPMISAADEGTALEAFGGDGAARIFDADPVANALLIEWLPGPSLVTERDHLAALRIAGELAGRLGRAPAPAGARSLCAGASAWRQQLLAQHDEADRTGAAFSDDVLARALHAVAELADDASATLTHGDLSQENILAAGPGRWVAIDPQLLAGTAAHEVHTIVRSRLVEVFDDPDPRRRLDTWTREAALAADVDLGSALRLSLARYVASAYWEAQNGGDPANVRRLRAATLLTARSVADR